MDTIVRGWIADILERHGPLLAIAVRQRAKFEGWLKFELAAHAERQGAAVVRVEAPYTDTRAGLSRSDVAFEFDGLRYDIELKTPNTNWRLPGVQPGTRPVTQNVREIIQDGRKLAYCAGQGLVAIVLFPVPAQDRRWTVSLDRIAAELGVPLTAADHATRLTVPLGGGDSADVVLCCFAVPRLQTVPAEAGAEDPPPPVPRHWLVRRLRLSDREFAHAIAQLRPMMRPGDELWSYDEPAPPDVNAGELGVALVRDGSPLLSAPAGIH